MKTTHVYDPIYDVKLTVYTDCLPADVKRLNSKYKTEIIKEDFVARWTSFDGTPEYVIAIRPEATADLLAHELIHHAVNVFHRIGIPILHDNDEAFAYYVQFLVSQTKHAFS